MIPSPRSTRPGRRLGTMGRALFIGAVTLAGVSAIALGWQAAAAPDEIVLAAADAPALPVEGRFPGFAGANAWLQSPPLSAESLRGKVVLVDIWTYGCSNCLNALPHVKEWAAKYKDQGLVVVGVHSPEFGYEHRIENVANAAERLGITFPIAIDNDFKIWNSFSNRFWPALYFVDAEGRVRHHHFGEGDYERSDEVIRALLNEAHGHVPKSGAAAG